VLQHVVRDAAEERADTGQAARAEDDQIDVELFNLLADQVWNRAFVGSPDCVRVKTGLSRDPRATHQDRGICAA
jgi:hypothetical protein